MTIFTQARRGGGGSTSPWTVVKKSADEVITNDATPSPDSDLRFDAEVGKTYLVEYYLKMASPAAADVKTQVSGPTGASVRHSDTFEQISTVGTSNLSSTTVNATTPQGVLRRAIVTGVTVAGEVILLWSQNTSDAGNTTLFEGSFLRYREWDV